MTQKDEKLKKDLENLIDKFNKGWHEGIEIDASDIILLNDLMEALSTIANAPTVEQATIVTQIDAVKFQEALDAMCVDKDKQIAEQSAEIAHYKAQINELREALICIDEDLVNPVYYRLVKEALDKTAPQCLQEHENEVIERCAKVCDEIGKRDQFTRITASAFAHEIRTLKGKQNEP